MAKMMVQFAAVRSDIQAMGLRDSADMRVLKWQIGLLCAVTEPSLLLLWRRGL